jgi:hypothetical protein
MSIGGQDAVLQVPAWDGTSDVVLRFVRQLWPHCVVESDDQPEPNALRSPSDWLRATREKEFYIYRDLAAAKIWDEKGQDPSNWNRMFYVLLDDRPGETWQLTVVVDELSPDVRSLLEGLRATLWEAFYSLRRLEAA